MSKKQAIMKKIGGFLAAVLVTMTILPVGQVNAMAATVPVENSGGKTADVDFTLDGATISGNIAYRARIVEGHSHGVRINTSIAINVVFSTTEALTPVSEGSDETNVRAHLTVNYDGKTFNANPHIYVSDEISNNTYEEDISFVVSGRNPSQEKYEKKKEESHSSSKSEEPKGNFAPDTNTMTPEQKAGWSVVSREPVVLAPNTSYGMSVSNAYQGPMCRLAFQMASPAGYALGHTYDMKLATGAGGNAGLKVPQDLMKTGRKYVVAFVVPGGPSVATAPLTPDEGGNINFNTNLLGLPAGSNYAMAIMYTDV